jgi:hypothetical protein
MLTHSDLYQPTGDLRPEHFSAVGVDAATLESWLTAYLSEAYTRTVVSGALEPDAAAAAWAYYRATRILSEEMARSAASKSLGGDITMGFSKEQITYWEGRSREYLAAYQDAISQQAASTPSNSSTRFSSSTPIEFSW